MIITGKFLEVTDIRDVNFVREGAQKTLKAYSFLVQWNISSESGASRSQELVVERLYEPDKAPNMPVGKIADENWYEMTIFFHASRSSKDGRVFNQIRLYKYSLPCDYGYQES